jgi:hypothetical protein
MTRLDAARAATFLRQQAPELTRIWRLARTAARPDVFPGLLDGVVEPFFGACAELLRQGGAPQEVWTALEGLVRWPPSRSPAEQTLEWAVVRDVVAAACEAVNAAPAVAEWLARAVEEADGGTALLGRPGSGPAGVVTAVVYSSVAPRRRVRDDDATPQ